MTYLDGGFGTMIQSAGLPAGRDPSDWCVEHPEAVTAIHRAYVEAGSEIVLANTFGLNRLKYHGAYTLEELLPAALKCARASGAGRVALDIGPLGRLMRDISFDDAFETFAETIRLASTTTTFDLVYIETMSDLYEVKAAALAAKENCDKPIYVTVTLGENGRLLSGADIDTIATVLESLGVEAYGFNCGLGPENMLPYVKRLQEISTRPIIVKPNAGMPKLVDGKTVFEVGPEAFAASMRKLVEAGATILGGCCGTTPEHIRRIAQ